jgi:hypothetical protein
VFTRRFAPPISGGPRGCLRSVGVLREQLLPGVEVEQHSAKLSAYELSQLSLGEGEPDKDSSGVLPSELKGQFEQAPRLPVRGDRVRKARITPHQIPSRGFPASATLK